MHQQVRRPLLSGNYPSLRIDIPKEGAENNVALNVVEDVYKRDFYSPAHHNFIGTEPVGDHFVVSVLSTPTKGTLHNGLKITKKGYTEEAFVVPDDPNIPLIDRMSSALPNFLDSKEGIYPVFHPQFPSDILKIEEKHPQKRTAMKIGLVYCRKGQSHPQEMFKNGIESDEGSVKFWAFLELMGKKIYLDQGWTGYTGDMRGGTSYYSIWKHVEVMYHVAPLLTSEGHRRLIGNDIAVIFFLEEGDDTLFDPSSASLLGTVPQIFAVVQPVGEKYRVGFFANINIKHFEPDLPLEQSYDPQFTKDLVLTKMYNGLVMANYCPPMNRLFYVPRKETIESIVANYPMETRKERRAREKKEKKEKESRITLDDTQVTFENIVETYSDINSLVLLVASNLAYLELSTIKSQVERELGFKSENVEPFERGEVQGYVACDEEKMFIVFGGVLSVKNMKKSLKSPKVPVCIQSDMMQIVLKGSVHKGFATPVMDLWEKIRDIFFRMYNGQRLWLAGHSLGGAVATLIAHLFAERIVMLGLSSKISKVAGIYTFGCPKIGDSIWSKTYDLLLKSQTFRVVQSNDIVPYLGSKTLNWHHGGNACPTQPNGLFNNLRINTQQSTYSCHQISSYFAVLAPLHKSALFKVLKDVRRDRIYSRTLEKNNSDWEDGEGLDSKKVRRPMVRGATVNRKLSHMPSGDMLSENSLSMDLLVSTSRKEFRRSKSLNSLASFVPPSPTLNRGSDMEEKSLTAELNDTKMSIKNLLGLLIEITGEELPEHFDISTYSHLRIKKEPIPIRRPNSPHLLSTNSNPAHKPEPSTDYLPTSLSAPKLHLSPTQSSDVALSTGDMGDITYLAVTPRGGEWGSGDSNGGSRSKRIALSPRSPGNNATLPRGVPTNSPKKPSTPSPKTPPLHRHHLVVSPQPVVPVLPPKAAVATRHDRQAQNSTVPLYKPPQQPPPQPPQTLTQTQTQPLPQAQAQIQRPPARDQSKRPTAVDYNILLAEREQKARERLALIEQERERRSEFSESPLGLTQQQSLQQRPVSQFNYRVRQPSNLPNRVPREIRQLRTRSKSVNEFSLSEGDESVVENLAVHSSKRPLISQLQANLTVLKTVIRHLQAVNFANPPPYLPSYDKPLETLVGIVQRLQSGKSESQMLERKLYAFSRIYPKFKQIGDAYRRGATTYQTFAEVLGPFSKVIDDLLEATVVLL